MSLKGLLCSFRRYWLLSCLALAPLLLVAAAEVRGARAAGQETGKPASPVEVPSLRTETSRTVQNADGSFTAEVSSEPINFRDAAGGWQPIDSSLVGSTAQGFAFENAANAFSVRFASSPAGTYSEFQSQGTGLVTLSLAGVIKGSCLRPQPLLPIGRAASWSIRRCSRG